MGHQAPCCYALHVVLCGAAGSHGHTPALWGAFHLMFSLSLHNTLRRASSLCGDWGGGESQSSAAAHTPCAQARRCVVSELCVTDPKIRRRFNPPLHAFSCRWDGVTWEYMESLPERPRIWTGWPLRACFSQTSTQPTPCAHHVSQGWPAGTGSRQGRRARQGRVGTLQRGASEGRGLA